MKRSRSRQRNESAATNRPRGARLWLFRTVAFVGVPLLFLALLEGGLELAGFGRPTAFFVESSQPGFVETNQFFGRRFFSASIARTPEVERLRRAKDQGTYRIFVLGGSAAMGFPEPAFGVGRVLETLLRQEYEGLRIEVGNAAMTAVNSHVVLPIARECARYEPDALVVYLGNNEVVGPYGPSSVFGDSRIPLPMVRAAVRLRATRTGQLIHRAAGLGEAASAPREWKGMSMFLENQVPWGDPRLETVYENFRANLREIRSAGLDAGARVVLSTVAVNLADSAPFASQSPELDAAAQRKWDGAYEAGVKLQAQERYAEAIESFQRAADLDGEHADLSFRLGQCLRALGRNAEARRHFEQARDLDTLRFRTDSRLNEIVREMARLEEGLALVDAEKLFEQAGDEGLTGGKRFYEHVHLNFSGNYLLARSIVDSLRDDLEQRGARRTGWAASEDAVAEKMVLTGWDRYRMLRDIAGLMEQPPFPNQLNHADVKEATTTELRELLGKRTPSEWKEEVAAVYESAMARTPEDLHLRRRYAELLDAAGRHAEAADEWRTLLDAAPGNLYWLTSLGASLREAGELDGASQAFRDVLETDSGNAAAHFGLGSVLQKRGKFAEAVTAYEEALRLRPGYAEAVNNLGLIAMDREQNAEALAHFQRAIEMRPELAEARENLGVTLLKMSQVEAARREFRRAAEINPDSGSARYHLGASLAAEGRVDEALPLLTEAARLDPDSAESHYSLGGVLASSGRMEQALHHLDQATRLNPKLAEAHYNKGLILVRQGRLEDAVSSYRAAIAARVEYPEAWNNMGTAYARQGKMQDAERCFEEALRVRPDFEDARRNLRNLQSTQSKE